MLMYIQYKQLLAFIAKSLCKKAGLNGLNRPGFNHPVKTG